MRFAYLMMVCALIGCSSENDCPGHTPGLVDCGGVECRIDRCWAPGRVDGGSVPPFAAPPSCLADGGTPRKTDGQPITCDGPEDCPEGQTCQVGEFFTRCSDGPNYAAACHTDCDCPSGVRCDGIACERTVR